MPACEVVDCQESVNKEGHTLCYDHWVAKRDGELSSCAACGRLQQGDKPLCYPCYKKKIAGLPSGDEALSSTELGKVFGVPAQRMNLILAELGWIRREPTKGWSPTPQGVQAGAIAREVRQSGIPFVVWNPKVQQNKAFMSVMRELGQGVEAVIAEDTLSERDPVAAANPRDGFPAAYRSQDGHRVRSRAECLIDDWLYVNRIVHAYERRLPLEETVVTDFYLPDGRVYIEYWGMPNDADYRTRMNEKLQIYKKHDFSLIELVDEHLKSLDDHLPRLLRKHGIAID